MILSEILGDVNLLVPNSINEPAKVRWLNQIQRQMYRDYAFPDTSHTFYTEPERSLYVVPDNCERDRITSVVVGNEEYLYRSIDQDVSGHCFSIIEDKLWIYPTPNREVDAYLNYRPRPRDMRVEMQTAKPDFPEDFHELLILGVAVRVARAVQNYKLASELEGSFAVMEMEAKKKLRPARQKKVQINKSWR